MTFISLKLDPQFFVSIPKYNIRRETSFAVDYVSEVYPLGTILSGYRDISSYRKSKRKEKFHYLQHGCVSYVTACWFSGEPFSYGV